MKEKLTIQKGIFIFFIVLGVIIIFTFADYLIHMLKEEYAVPSYYYKNKVIFGTGIGFIVYLFVKKKKLFAKTLIFSLTISILLQVRYFLEGYPLKFVLLFLVIHFLILFPVSLLAFRLFEKYV